MKFPIKCLKQSNWEEVENKIKELENEVNELTRYVKFKNDEINLMNTTLTNIIKEKKALEGEKFSKTVLLESTLVKKTKLREENMKLKQCIMNMNDSIDSKQQEVDSLRSELTKYQEHIDKAINQINNKYKTKRLNKKYEKNIYKKLLENKFL